MYLNTKSQKREGKLWTYTYTNNTKAQRDYVFINEKWNNSALNCKAYSSFGGVSSDHRIAAPKIRLSLRRNTTRTTTAVPYDAICLRTRILEINMREHRETNSMYYRRRQKHVLRMMNMRISSIPS